MITSAAGRRTVGALLGGAFCCLSVVLLMLRSVPGSSGPGLNSVGVPLPADAAPPGEQVLTVFAVDATYMDWFRSIYKGTPGQYLISEPLTRVDKDLNLLPAGAESWEVSRDGLTWTFHIRRGMRWTDGAPVTAHDYVYSLRRGSDPENAYDFEWYYGIIKNWRDVVGRRKPVNSLGVAAADDYALCVTTEERAPYLPYLLTYTWICPRQAVEEYGEAWSTRPETSVSCGPFKLAEWHKGDRIVMVANPDYGGAARPYLERIIFKLYLVAAQPPVLPAYEVGEVDFAAVANQAELARVKAHPVLSKELHSYVDFNTYYLFMQTEKGVLSSLKVRQALSHAIDRAGLCRSALHGFAVPAVAMLPPGFPAADADRVRAIQRYDPGLARDLLAEAGYPDGEGFPKLEMWLRNESAANRAAAEGIQAMLKQNLGIDIQVRNMEAKTFMDGLNSKRTPFGMVGYQYDYVDPSNLLGVWVSGGRHAWHNPRFDKLVKKASAFMGPTVERTHMFQEAERVLVEDAAGVFLWHPVVNQLWKSYVKGDALEPNRFGVRAWRGDQLQNQTVTIYISKGKLERRARR